jgi:TPR repeat protein
MIFSKSHTSGIPKGTVWSMCVSYLTRCCVECVASMLLVLSMTNAALAQSIAELIKQAEDGDVKAQFELACDYHDGSGVVPSDAMAFSWVHKAALQGLPSAENYLGILYDMGIGVENDHQQALVWWEAAAQQGERKAEFNIGRADYDSGSYTQALSWLQKSAQQGVAEAALYVGLIYVNGYGVTKDYQEAMRWYRMAADGGNDDAMLKLGFSFEFPGVEGNKQDITEAMRWYG